MNHGVIANLLASHSFLITFGSRLELFYIPNTREEPALLRYLMDRLRSGTSFPYNREMQSPGFIPEP